MSSYDLFNKITLIRSFHGKSATVTAKSKDDGVTWLLLMHADNVETVETTVPAEQVYTKAQELIRGWVEHQTALLTRQGFEITKDRT